MSVEPEPGEPSPGNHEKVHGAAGGAILARAIPDQPAPRQGRVRSWGGSHSPHEPGQLGAAEPKPAAMQLTMTHKPYVNCRADDKKLVVFVFLFLICGFYLQGVKYESIGLETKNNPWDGIWANSLNYRHYKLSLPCNFPQPHPPALKKLSITQLSSLGMSSFPQSTWTPQVMGAGLQMKT